MNQPVIDPAVPGRTPETVGPTRDGGASDERRPPRGGLKLAALAAVCVAGCIAVPLAIGVASAIGGAAVGRPWMVAVAVALTAVAAILARRRGGRSVC